MLGIPPEDCPECQGERWEHVRWARATKNSPLIDHNHGRERESMGCRISPSSARKHKQARVCDEPKWIILFVPCTQGHHMLLVHSTKKLLGSQPENQSVCAKLNQTELVAGTMGTVEMRFGRFSHLPQVQWRLGTEARLTKLSIDTRGVSPRKPRGLPLT